MQKSGLVWCTSKCSPHKRHGPQIFAMIKSCNNTEPQYIAAEAQTRFCVTALEDPQNRKFVWTLNIERNTEGK